jgi:hypothetical protein
MQCVEYSNSPRVSAFSGCALAPAGFTSQANNIANIHFGVMSLSIVIGKVFLPALVPV